MCVFFLVFSLEQHLRRLAAFKAGLVQSGHDNSVGWGRRWNVFLYCALEPVGGPLALGRQLEYDSLTTNSWKARGKYSVSECLSYSKNTVPAVKLFVWSTTNLIFCGSCAFFFLWGGGGESCGPNAEAISLPRIAVRRHWRCH